MTAPDDITAAQVRAYSVLNPSIRSLEERRASAIDLLEWAAGYARDFGATLIADPEVRAEFAAVGVDIAAEWARLTAGPTP